MCNILFTIKYLCIYVYIIIIILQARTPKCYLGIRSSHNRMAIGSAVVLQIKIYVPPGSTADYHLEVYAPSNESLDGQFHICDVRISTAGWNLPCVSDKFVPPWAYNKSDVDNSTVSSAILQLGYISNMLDTGTVQDDKNLVMNTHFLSLLNILLWSLGYIGDPHLFWMLIRGHQQISMSDKKRKSLRFV